MLIEKNTCSCGYVGPCNTCPKCVKPTVAGHEEMILYAVRSRDGKWFRRKGYGGWGDSWTDDFKKARIYQKIGHARAIVSFFYGKWPQYGVPDLMRLKIGSAVVVSEEEDRAKKVKKAKEEKEAAAAVRRRQRDLDSAQREFESARQNLDRLRLSPLVTK